MLPGVQQERNVDAEKGGGEGRRRFVQGREADVVAARLGRKGLDYAVGPRRRVVVEHLDAGALEPARQGRVSAPAEDADNVFERRPRARRRDGPLRHRGPRLTTIRGREEDPGRGRLTPTRRQRRRRAGPLVDDGLVCRRDGRAARGGRRHQRDVGELRTELRDSGKPALVEGRRRLRVSP